MDISVGHTPDSDDAFMFYAMFTDKVKSDDFSVTHVIEDIENLNKKAKNPELDVVVDADESIIVFVLFMLDISNA